MRDGKIYFLASEDGVSTEYRVLGEVLHPGFDPEDPAFKKLREVERLLGCAHFHAGVQISTWQEEGNEYAREEGSGNLGLAEEAVDKVRKLIEDIY